MYFNKILASFSLAVLSLGFLNSLPVYTVDDKEVAYL